MDFNIEKFKQVLKDNGVDVKALSKIEPKKSDPVNIWDDEDGYNQDIKDTESFVGKAIKKNGGYTQEELSQIHQAMSYLDGTEGFSDEDIAIAASLGGDENNIDSKDIERLLQMFDNCDCTHDEIHEEDYFKLKNPTNKAGEEKIQEREDGSKFVNIEKPNAKDSERLDSLAKVMSQCYNLDEMGIEEGTPEYAELLEVVMDANPQIYGTKDFTGKYVGGRIDDFSGERADIALVPGEEFNIPEADAFCHCGCFGEKTKLPNAYIENSKLNYDEEDGIVYVVVEGKDGDNNSLEAIINKNYDLVGLGIEKGTPEYQALKNAIMDANPEIYGTIDETGHLVNGRMPTVPKREKSPLKEGEIFNLPNIDPECICHGKGNAQATPTPTDKPTVEPTAEPTGTPSVTPTPTPTTEPTSTPTTKPTPTTEPTKTPIPGGEDVEPDNPTPSTKPTPTPTEKPTPTPTEKPTPTPTEKPTPTPTEKPSAPSVPPIQGGTEVDVEQPNTKPSDKPSGNPTDKPTQSETPADKPSDKPSDKPGDCTPPKSDDVTTEKPPQIDNSSSGGSSTPSAPTESPKQDTPSAPAEPPKQDTSSSNDTPSTPSSGCDSPQDNDKYVEEEEPTL